MNFFDGVSIAMFKEILQSERDVVVENLDHSVVIVIDLSKIDGIFVVNVLEDVNFFLQNRVLFLAFVEYFFLYQDFLVITFILLDLSEGKLAGFHIYDSIKLHIFV